MSTPRHAIDGSEIRRVLLVEPVFHIHALIHCEAALASTGFEQAEVTIASAIPGEQHRSRMAAFVERQPRARLRLLEGYPSPLTNRLQNVRLNRHLLQQVERILRAETFDLVAYMKLDYVLPFLALPIFRRAFRAHWTQGVSGLIFNDNGLRTPQPANWRNRVRAALDHFVLGRAVRSPAIRRLAFFDPACAKLAGERWGGEKCRAGVDPIFLPPEQPTAVARARFGIPADAFAVLLFGSFSERKGIVQMLEILRDTVLPRPLHILLGGPVEASIRSRFDEAVASVKARHSVHHHDGFVPDADMADYFAAADTVLCAYRNFTGSSGILLHAAAHGKPALVSPHGVMADAVTLHDCGAVVDLDHPETVQAALARFAALDEPTRAQFAERAYGYAKLNDARLYLSQFL